MKKIPIYNLEFDENIDAEGVSKISLVNQPAIDVNFLAFNKEDESEKRNYIFSKEQQIITTPILIAGKHIYRKSAALGEYFVVFTKETISKIVKKYFKDGNGFSFNTGHKDDVTGIYIFESYIINRERGINPPNEFSDLPDGSWMGSFKVDNLTLWESIKKGEYKGVSVECFMDLINTNKSVMLSADETKEKELLEYLESVVKELGKIKN